MELLSSVGGFFATAGGNPANNIAVWNVATGSWSPLGSGLNADVDAIALSDLGLYAGGFFTQAGGGSASRIARWDGSAWSSLGSGVNTTVNAIALNGSDLYVGGQFTQAGGRPASYIARWVEQGTATDPTENEETPGIEEAPGIHAAPNPMTSGANLSFQSIGFSPLTLSIYDTAGRLVRTQDLGALPAGSHTHYWDGRDASGSALASGVYFVRLSSTEQQASARVVLVR